MKSGFAAAAEKARSNNVLEPAWNVRQPSWLTQPVQRGPTHWLRGLFTTDVTSDMLIGQSVKATDKGVRAALAYAQAGDRSSLFGLVMWGIAALLFGILGFRAKNSEWRKAIEKTGK